MLLPGDHVLQRELSLSTSARTGSVIMLRGVSSTEKIFLQSEEATIATKNARNFTIEYTFILHHNRQSFLAPYVSPETSLYVLKIIGSHVAIINCMFLGRENNKTSGGSIYSKGSNVTVLNSLFKRTSLEMLLKIMGRNLH